MNNAWICKYYKDKTSNITRRKKMSQLKKEQNLNNYNFDLLKQDVVILV